MSDTALHITNGDSLTDYLKDLDFAGDMITWREMLCEGPTMSKINSEAFFQSRKSFLKEFYNVNEEEYVLEEELRKLDHADKYTEIVLWFEYDLFCHINLLGVINLIQQRGITTPLSLVCSGRVEGHKQLKGLGELSPDQIYVHYTNRMHLQPDDITLMVDLWNIYCGKDHNIFKPYITSNSSFKYLTNCLKAHLKRFPNQKTGLSTIEENILNIVKNEHIKSMHHLLGYSLNYQGYYGFGDVQLKRIIDGLNQFLHIEEDRVTLNRKGHEALLGQHNFSQEINNRMVYGGINRLDFIFNSEENKLVKTIPNVH